MARPLHKVKLDGALYSRRPAVEAEIQYLEVIGTAELERRASDCSRTSPDFVSPEASVHFVRNVESGIHRETLTERLLERLHLLLPRADDASLTNAIIRATRLNWAVLVGVIQGAAARARHFAD